MLKHQLLLATCTSLLLAVDPANAQDIDLSDLKGNIDIFSGALEEALNLNQSSGLFGISQGGVESTYLYGQGVVAEVRSQLANQRNRLSLASLNAAMQSLQTRGNPLQSIQRAQQAAATEQAPVSVSGAATADSFYQEMMDRIANIDYSLIVNSAIQQATESARSLRNLGDMDDPAYEAMRVEIDSLREDMQANLNELRRLEREIETANSQSTAAATAQANSVTESDSTSARLSQQLDALLARIEPLREQALTMASDLKERTESAEQRYAERWQQELLDFETDLYAAMCDYGGTLRELPMDEHISIILKGLGEESDSRRRRDKVHVFSKADVQQCQNGDIDVAILKQRTTQYSY